MKEMRQEMLQLQEMLQALLQDMEVEAIVELVAATAEATADAQEDRLKRARMLWYARPFRRLAEGPPAYLGLDRAKRRTGKEAVMVAFGSLLLRVNRICEQANLPPDDLEWVDRLGKELGHVATMMEL